MEKCGKEYLSFVFHLVNYIDILFGIQNETCDEIIDKLKYCALFAKFYIYRSKKSESKVFFFKFVHIKKNRCFENKIYTTYVSQYKYEKCLY